MLGFGVGLELELWLCLWLVFSARGICSYII